MRRILLFIICLCTFLVAGCDSDIEPDSLLGMSKGEVLRSAFDKCTFDAHGELNIGTWNVEKNGKRAYQNLYYKSLDAALKDPRLMDCDIWEIRKKCKFSFSIYQKEECLELVFEQGKVVKAEKKYWAKT